MVLIMVLGKYSTNISTMGLIMVLGVLLFPCVFIPMMEITLGKCSTNISTMG